MGLKRILVSFLLVAALALPAWGADTAFKTWIASLTAITSPATTDVLYILADPGGTPTNKKVTLGDLLAVRIGTLTDTKWCYYYDGKIQCTQDTPATAGHNHTGVYQPLDSDLEVIAGLACTTNQIIKRNAGGTWECAADATGGTPSFADITTGTNTVALSMGTGGTLGTTGTGTITANRIDQIVAAGDVVVGSASKTPTVITKGASNSLFGVDGTGTLGFLTTLNVSTFNLPSSDSDPGTTAGQIKHDSSDTNANSGGTLKLYDGANVRTMVDSGTNYTIIIKTEYIPVAYMEDGATAPAAASVLASTRKVRIRAFDGAANEDLEFMWMVPDDYVGGTKFRFIGYVNAATAPANTEVVAFELAGCSIGNSDILSCTVGTAQTSSLTADATYVQYDRLAGAYSSAITVTNITAGESAHFKLTRLATTTDTYAQDFGLAGIEIKYQAKVMLNSTY